MTNGVDHDETGLTKRLRRLEERVLPGKQPGPGELTGTAGEAPNLALNIATTNLADTEEIRQWFVAPPDATTAVLATHLLNEAGQAPTGLDVVIYDFTESAEVYRNNTTYNEPEGLTLTAGDVHYVSIENGSGTTQNANVVLALESA